MKNCTVVTVTILLVFILAFPVFGDTRLGISGTVEWDTMRINAVVHLNLASAGIRMPAGRTQGEAILSLGYLNLIRPGILNLQVDSSSTIGDLLDRGEFSMREAENIALNAEVVPPALSPDMLTISSSYTVSLSGISSALLKHTRPQPVMRTLTPVSAAQYTGIIIIASDSLPVHGMRSTATPIPCLFPKIWDTDMNLIYDRNMLETNIPAMVRYAPPQSIFQRTPSGLTPELIQVVGERPLRIFAKGVFGSKPTDLIIDTRDAMLIISSEENRRLLSQGKVAIILDDDVLRREF